MKIATVGLLLALSPALAQGQALYKCQNSQGTTSYQQVPCTDNDQDLGRVRYQKEPDSPHWSSEGHAAAQARERQVAEATRAGSDQNGNAGQRQPARRSPGGFAEEEERRRFAHLAGTREGRAQLRAENKLPPLPPPPPPPSTKTYTDQHGGTYTQPPGGAIIENRTGRACRQEGNTLVCD